MIDVVEAIVGAPFSLVELKRKPGRRHTLRARGPRRSVILKVYASDRAPVVASRVAALAAGPAEPVVPEVLHVDAERHLVVLSDVPGVPLRDALVAGNRAKCAAAGRALGKWHAAWEGQAPEALREHTAARELEILHERAARASESVASVLDGALPHLQGDWECRTVVHRDLYEEQVLVGRRVGLIDLDDAAAGPPELDVGNLLAHIQLLELRRGRDLARVKEALVEGYAETGPRLEDELLWRCRALTLLRLVCLNDGPVANALAEGALA